MSTVRPGQPGAARLCPHCKATVLESAAICPGCRHHLRFSNGKQLAAGEPYNALSIDGTIAHKVAGEQCEYCVVLDIRNERGEQLLRQVVGVGALQPGELRRLNVSVGMLPVLTAREAATKPVTPPARTPVAVAPAAAAKTAPAAPAAAGKAPPASAAAGGTSAPAATVRAVNPAGAAASVAKATPTLPSAPRPTASPRPSLPVADSKPANLSPPAPGGALSQRLRIFRKP